MLGCLCACSVWLRCGLEAALRSAINASDVRIYAISSFLSWRWESPVVIVLECGVGVLELRLLD